MNGHPSVAPKDRLEDVLNYLRYAALFAPQIEETESESQPAGFWLVVVFLSLTAAFAGFAFGVWVLIRMLFKFLGWL